jgi:hypothetical protein
VGAAPGLWKPLKQRVIRIFSGAEHSFYALLMKKKVDQCCMRNPRSDPWVMIFLLALGFGMLFFGGRDGLGPGALILWFLSTILFPAICGGFLCRVFGNIVGTIIAAAPVWVALILAITHKLWMPLFRGF